MSIKKKIGAIMMAPIVWDEARMLQTGWRTPDLRWLLMNDMLPLSRQPVYEHINGIISTADHTKYLRPNGTSMLVEMYPDEGEVARIFHLLAMLRQTQAKGHNIDGNKYSNFGSMIGDAFSQIEHHSLCVGSIVANPFHYPAFLRMKKDHFDEENTPHVRRTGLVGQLWGANVWISEKALKDEIFVLAQPDYCGVFSEYPNGLTGMAIAFDFAVTRITF